jgi:hypothetical protein
MVEALEYLASLQETGTNTIIEDKYCCICSINSKITTIKDPRCGFDYPRDLIVGVGGIYAPDETYPGGARPIYRVVV